MNNFLYIVNIHNVLVLKYQIPDLIVTGTIFSQKTYSYSLLIINCSYKFIDYFQRNKQITFHLLYQVLC